MKTFKVIHTLTNKEVKRDDIIFHRYSGLQARYFGSNGKDKIVVKFKDELLEVTPVTFHCEIKQFDREVV